MAFKQIAFDFSDAPEPQEPAAKKMPAEAPEEKAEIKTSRELTESETNESLVEENAPIQLAIDEEIREVEFISAPVKTKELTARKSTRGRMRLSDMHIGADLIEIPEDEILFQKSYYSIGTVSEMFKVNISLIRFWENEFDILKPKKNGKGDRHFRPEDIKNLKIIHHLLRERKYTIEGAKEFLKKNKKTEQNFALIEELKKIKSFLHELKANF
ncbi:MAG: regulatory protein MerR [Ferruginibacter sp.]|nr:regulatory protein MerR [Ferruginibacter sp.]